MIINDMSVVTWFLLYGLVDVVVVKLLLSLYERARAQVRYGYHRAVGCNILAG